MNIKNSKKIIASIIILIMIIGMMSPVFAATNNSLSGGLFNSFLTLFTQGTKTTVKTFADLLSKKKTVATVENNNNETKPSENNGKTSKLTDANLTKIVNFIAKFEGNGTTKKNNIECYKATKDTDGKMKCVGVGISTLAPVTGNYYKKSEVDQIVKKAVNTAQNFVINKANSVNLCLEQNELMALTSFAYQCSSTSVSNVIKTFKKEGKKAGMERLLLYTKAGGTTLGGIVKRRNAEACLIMDGSYNGNYCNDKRTNLKYYKEVLKNGYEFSYSEGKSQISSYRACYNKVSA